MRRSFSVSDMLRRGACICATLVCCCFPQSGSAQDVNVAPPQNVTPVAAQEAAALAPPEYFGAVPADDVAGRIEQLEETVRSQQEMMALMQQQLQANSVVPNQPGERYKVGSRLNMQGVWNHGLEFRTPNKDFYFHVGGRTQWDNVYMNSTNVPAALVNTSPNTARLQDASDFRRARLRMEGSMYETIDWCMEYNFVNAATMMDPTVSTPPQVPGGGVVNSGSAMQVLQNRTFNVVSPVDLWWNVREVPIFGNIQFGNMKEPFNLQRLESSRYLDFLERDFAGDAFVSPSANGFAPGIMAWNWTNNRRMTYALGVFKNVTNGNVFNVGDGQGEIAGRLTWLPVYDEPSNGRYFVHIGMGASQRAIDNNLIRYRTRGELRNGPDALLTAWADTTYLGGQYQEILNPELMIQRGPLFIQAEYTANWTTNCVTFPAGTSGNGNPAQGQPVNFPGAVNHGDVFFGGGYVHVMYFLTGEHRIYDYQKGLVGRVIPNENAFWVKGRDGRLFGRGAWQVGYRFNYLNLNNSGIYGGEMLGHTLGLNWFWNPNSKVQFNFDIMDRSSPSNQANLTGNTTGAGVNGTIYGFGVRFAADF
jgi:phosphate-selective porin OprO/OprP